MALRLNGSSSGYVELDVPAAAGSHTLTLPDGGGSSGQYLQTDGSGGLSWQTLPAKRPLYLRPTPCRTETDWVTLKAIDDSNDGLGIQLPQVWMDYRQALRDLPANTVDPANPVWPVKPGA
jgi:hypothetical protein